MWSTAAILSLVVVSAASAQRAAAPTGAPLSSPKVVYEGSMGLPAGRWIVRSAEEYTRMTRSRTVPKIDFDKQMLIIASMGLEGGGSDRIAVTSVSDRDNLLDIQITVTTRGLEPCLAPAITSSPVSMVVVDRSMSTPVFHDTVVRRRC